MCDATSLTSPSLPPVIELEAVRLPILSAGPLDPGNR